MEYSAAESDPVGPSLRPENALLQPTRVADPAIRKKFHTRASCPTPCRNV